MDKIIVNNLQVRNIIGVDGWERSKRQPVLLTITVFVDTQVVGECDQLSLNYGTLSKVALAFSEASTYRSVEQLANGLVMHLYDTFDMMDRCVVKVIKPKSLLHASAAGCQVNRIKADLLWLKQLEKVMVTEYSINDFVFIQDLEVVCIIGINPWERLEKQRVIVNLKLYGDGVHLLTSGTVQKQHNYQTIARMVQTYVEESCYKTVEAMAASVARLCILDCKVHKLTVSIQKPSALLFAESACIEISRSIDDFMDANGVQHGTLSSEYVCAIALGSNVGDRYNNIQQAVYLLSQKITILDTSFLYESLPKYVEDQGLFLNAVVKVSTTMKPEDLLQCCQDIEKEVGRVATFKYGPRVVDLDILLYGESVMNSDALTIPHPLMKEREFVLRPLVDVMPNFEHPKLKRTYAQLLKLLLRIKEASEESEVMRRVTQAGNTLFRWGEKTLIMGVLNVTPDSFSEQGDMYPQLIDGQLTEAYKQKLLGQVNWMIENGCNVIDIGGQSTRPNAIQISVEEEIDRVLPVIKFLKDLAKTDLPISIDTFNSIVAQQAVKAGADIVNDVSGGQRDPLMMETVASLRVPYIVMHMRGDSSTMMSLTDYKGDLIGSIRRELLSRTREALAAGVYRWNIFIDAGVGFAKNMEQNIELFKNLPDIFSNVEDRHHSEQECKSLLNFPMLIGPSRKAFIGKLTGKNDPKDRKFGTAAVVTACISSKTVDIVRVHDVAEMSDVVKVADALYR